ncbi:MAG: adenine phosphoribosyltransferase [Gemmatimonadota bacterium]|nr:adenine phosphoribosyltransferase [Gemmatimonadota bacterium]
MRGSELERLLRAAVRDVPDFPKPGIIFKDITPVLSDCALFAASVHAMASAFAEAAITHVVGIESRGFILGAPIALELHAAFVPVRKVGKLPAVTEREEYALEYGSAALEIHSDALGAGAHVLVVDDVLATGGTARAACTLVERLSGVVIGCTFLIELGCLGGGTAITPRRWNALITY